MGITLVAVDIEKMVAMETVPVGMMLTLLQSLRPFWNTDKKVDLRGFDLKEKGQHCKAEFLLFTRDAVKI